MPVIRRATSQPVALGYVRVSSTAQAASGLSLEHQEARIRAMAIVRECTLLDIIADAGESGKTLDRPGMARLLALVDRRAVTAVIVGKLDPLTRSVRDLADLLERFERRGVALVSVTESLDTATAAGRLVLNVMMSVAQWEREAIGERTRDALKMKRRRGERAGELPYGHRSGVDGKLQLYEPEQRIVARITDARAAGPTLRAIAHDLNGAGFRTRTGGAWRHQNIDGILATLDRHASR